MNLREKIDWHYSHFRKHYFPFLWCKKLYRERIGRPLNFSDPRDINEKILWLSFFTDTTLWTKLADKYIVREYIKEKIGEHYLIPLLGKWDKAEEINFDSLPDKFVIKPNNGSYDTIIVRDKKKANFDEIRQRLELSLKSRFGFEYAEPHYLRIKPCIIAEQLLEANEDGGLKEYKIHCLNGRPHSTFLASNRDIVAKKVDWMQYDLMWNRRPEWISPNFRNESKCVKPAKLELMLNIASKLSANIPYVRVDLYFNNDKIYFSEMTFTPNFGMIPYYTQDFLEELGSHCVLPKRLFYEKVKTFFSRWTPLL